MNDGQEIAEETTNAEFPDLKKLSASGVPMPIVPKNPIRFSIRGVTDRIDTLKEFVAAQDFDSGLKVYIAAEIDKLKSNAAEIHMHDVEQPDGGFDLHLSIRPRNLGAHASAVFKREGDAGAS